MVTRELCKCICGHKQNYSQTRRTALGANHLDGCLTLRHKAIKEGNIFVGGVLSITTLACSVPSWREKLESRHHPEHVE